MSSENPNKCMGDSEQVGGGSQKQVSNQASTQSDNDDTSPQSSSQNSPIKKVGGTNENSPTKGKNRRKNDGRRRSGSHKKQGAAANIEQQSERQHQNHHQPKVSPSSTPNRTLDDRKLNDSEDNRKKETAPKTQQLEPGEASNESTSNNNNNISRSSRSGINKDRLREYKQLKEQFKSQNAQIKTLIGQVKQQTNRVTEMESALLSTTRTCNQLERLLQQELSSRTRLEAENESLCQSIQRLKTQLNAHEKNKSANDELIRVLNATLMERETEVSILKLKLTRVQTNPSSSMALNSASSVSSVHYDPCQAYATTGRSNSEFDRNSYIRSSMIAEAASIRASTNQLRISDRDASVWATVPEELTPSKRPEILERSFQPNYGDTHYNPYGIIGSSSSSANQTSTPLTRDRRYKTLPRSMKSPSQEFANSDNNQRRDSTSKELNADLRQTPHCQITNLDESNSTSQSSGNRTNSSSNYMENKQQTPSLITPQVSCQNTGSLNLDKDRLRDNFTQENVITNDQLNKGSSDAVGHTHYSRINEINNTPSTSEKNVDQADLALGDPPRSQSKSQYQGAKPVKFSNGLKKIIDKFRRSDSSVNSQSKTDLTNSAETPVSNPFKRGANRSTLVGTPNNIRAQITPVRQAMNFQTNKPFADWDTEMIVDWLTMIGLSMYTNQCRRWVECGAHIMNATPAEVDKGLGITNHLHRKKLRLAISELNGDCDKVTKAASRLDYLWVARWLDDMGLPQYKEAFINARVDGRVLNYLTVEDLVSLGVKSILHHASIRCGIRVLRTINFDLQMLKRRATADEIDQMSSIRQQMNKGTDDNPTCFPPKQTSGTIVREAPDFTLWTCHRVMEWLRLIDFAEFAPNLRGSGVHGGLIVFEDGFNIDTMCSLLSIPIGRTLLRRHFSTFFNDLIGEDLSLRKKQYQHLSSNRQLNLTAEIKTPKKSPLWFNKLKSSKVGQDGLDEYLCPMYPVEPQIVKNPSRKNEVMNAREGSHLPKIPESINV